MFSSAKRAVNSQSCTQQKYPSEMKGEVKPFSDEGKQNLSPAKLS